jgi:hypothetical protein
LGSSSSRSRTARPVSPWYRFRVEVTVPAGALSERRKAGLVADGTTAVLEAAGLTVDDGVHARSTNISTPPAAAGPGARPPHGRRARSRGGLLRRLGPGFVAVVALVVVLLVL